MDRFEEAKQRIKDGVDLVDLVQADVPLQRRGRLQVGLCPFHAEKSPSFTVYADTQHYKCYGCGVSGDVFTFLMEREGLSFREAMEILAERVGVSLEGVFGKGGRRDARREAAHESLARVRDWFETVLYEDEGAPAREYLERRGLLELAEEFGLGAHPSAPGRLVELARRHDLPKDVLGQAGLLTRDGREPMRGRVMFPITDERGRVVGFGGRVLPDPNIPPDQDERPKYRNSPESPFFNKRRLLYGLRQVKRAGDRRVIVVEGYTDVIALHRAGFTGAVATLGTALTRDHSRLLERYATDGVVLLFDGDRAGRRAADRAFRELVHTALPVRIALLPEGVDPADLVAVEPSRSADERDAGRRDLELLLERADDALTTWFRLWRSAVDLTADANVQRVATECGRILAEVENRARRESLRRAMATHLGLSEAAIPIPDRAPRRRDDDGEPVPAAPPRPRPVASDKGAEADLDLLACVLRDSALVGAVDELPGEFPAWLGKFLGWVRAAVDGGQATSYEALVKVLFGRVGEEPELRRYLDETVERARRVRDPRVTFEQLRHGREVFFAKQEAARLKRQVQQALADGDAAAADALTRQLTELLRRSTGGRRSGSEAASGR